MKTIKPAELEPLLADTHHALRRVGDAAGVWEELQCTCGRPGCEIHDPARHSVTLQLDTLAAFWDAESAPAEERERLSAALIRLGDALGLLYGAPAPPDDPQALLHHLRDRWLAGMGTPLGWPADGEGGADEAWLVDLYRVEARNRLLLDRLLARMAATPFARLADAGAAHARERRGHAHLEGITACKRVLRTWMDDQDTLPERTLLREHLLRIINEAPWSAGEAQDVAVMAEDAACAVLAFGIADDTWTTAAYGAMQRVAPLSALRVDLVLGEGPTTPAAQ
jgi:hypothetical protein